MRWVISAGLFQKSLSGAWAARATDRDRLSSIKTRQNACRTPFSGSYQKNRHLLECRWSINEGRRDFLGREISALSAISAVKLFPPSASFFCHLVPFCVYEILLGLMLLSGWKGRAASLPVAGGSVVLMWLHVKRSFVCVLSIAAISVLASLLFL